MTLCSIIVACPTHKSEFQKKSIKMKIRNLSSNYVVTPEETESVPFISTESMKSSHISLIPLICIIRETL